MQVKSVSTLLPINPTQSNIARCANIWLTTKAQHPKTSTVDTEHNEDTMVPSGVVQTGRPLDDTMSLFK